TTILGVIEQREGESAALGNDGDRTTRAGWLEAVLGVHRRAERGAQTVGRLEAALRVRSAHADSSPCHHLRDALLQLLTGTPALGKARGDDQRAADAGRGALLEYPLDHRRGHHHNCQVNPFWHGSY